VLKSILDLFSKATGMEYNIRKSTISHNLLSDEEINRFKDLFPFESKSIDEGLKYLGFNLKPTNYKKVDWLWLLEKLDKRLKTWSHKWLSRAGRLVLVKSVLEAIPVYWMSLSWIPKGILESYRKVCFRFLWSGKKESQVTPWVRWEKIAQPKEKGGWGLKNIFLFSKALAAKAGWRLLATPSLWQKVMIQKYIAPESVESWIRNPIKNKRGISVIWKAILNSFPIISNKLAWKIGSGEKVRIGVDPWQGGAQRYILPLRIVEALKERGIETLRQLADEQSTSFWMQEWRSARALGLNDDISPAFDHYISGLKSCHIRLRDRVDELIWDEDPRGFYTPKVGYRALSNDLNQRDPKWWWKKLWKINCPPKSKLFMWSVLENKAPTWDNLQKKQMVGPGWCCLCKNAEESVSHIFLFCNYSAAVWEECAKLVGVNLKWEGTSLEQVWSNWVINPSFQDSKSLPLIVIWGIWLARNESIFSDKAIPSELTAAKSISILAAYPQKVKKVKEKNLSVIEIDKSKPWGFFDGASQNNLCGGGALLYLNDGHYFRIAIGLGEGTNNLAEILSLKMLLVFAIDHNIKNITIYGDSMNVINWINGTQRCLHLKLENLLEEIMALKLTFEEINCHHIYRIQNEEADKESKKGLQLDAGVWTVSEYHGSRVTEIPQASLFF